MNRQKLFRMVFALCAILFIVGMAVFLPRSIEEAQENERQARRQIEQIILSQMQTEVDVFLPTSFDQVTGKSIEEMAQHLVRIRNAAHAPDPMDHASKDIPQYHYTLYAPTQPYQIVLIPDHTNQTITVQCYTTDLTTPTYTRILQ